MSAGHKWRKLQRATPKPPSEAVIEAWMQEYDQTREVVLERIKEEVSKIELWKNDLYQCEVRRYPELVWICIRRTDGYPGRDWRHFQQIKNELVGPEHEGVELYPSESRLVDTSNKYHLFVVTDPAYRFPFGYSKRDIRDDDGESVKGLRQRPLMQHATCSTCGKPQVRHFAKTDLLCECTGPT